MPEAGQAPLVLLIVFIIVLLLWVATVYSDLTTLKSRLVTTGYPRGDLLP